MNVSNIGPSPGAAPPQGPPPSVTRSDLEALQQRIKQAGGTAPQGLDKLIQGFDAVAGKDGSMTQDQFTSYAARNGVDLPKPRGHSPGRPPGHPPGGPPGRPGAPPAGGGGRATGTTTTTSPATETDAQLATAAARGDAAAIREIARRAAEKTRTASVSARDGVGTRLSVQA